MAIRIANNLFKPLTYLKIPSKRCIVTNVCLYNEKIEKTVIPMNERIDLRTEREKLIEKKFQELMVWYEKISGLAEVRLFQDRVIRAQDELLKIQAMRRNLNNELTQISTKRTEMQTKSHRISREDPEWYTLITEESRLLIEEKKLRDQIQNIERNERDYFTFMCNAVRDSHEKQRWQADRTKYWSLVVTVLSSFITYLISDTRHKRIVQSLIENTNKNIPTLKELKNITQNEPQILNQMQKMYTETWEKIKQIEAETARNTREYKEFNESISNWIKTVKENNGDTIIRENQLQIIDGSSFGLGIFASAGILLLLYVLSR